MDAPTSPCLADMEALGHPQVERQRSASRRLSRSQTRARFGLSPRQQLPVRVAREPSMPSDSA
jgi:hypothetical protein